jgi:enamine deaminase RidA (YjgF/YER057c/UK114 family)
MAKQVVKSDKLSPVYGPYSHAVRAGDMVFLHGTVGVDAYGRLPDSTAGRTDMAAQCAQTLENRHTALELLGGSLQDVVQVRAFLPQHCADRRGKIRRLPLMSFMTSTGGISSPPTQRGRRSSMASSSKTCW